MKKTLFNLAFVLSFSFNFLAQCPTGQVNVTVDVITDDWGYECFWDLTPSGNGCGNGALFTFGNIAEVNCTSGGSAVATSGGYPDNSTTTESLGCLTVGNCFDINYVDDYGDGGATFVVKFDGIVMHTFTNDFTIATATHTFCIITPPVHDAAISTAGSNYLMIPLSQSLNFVAPAKITSAGTGTITGTKANVKVFKAGSQVHAVSSATQTLTTLTSGNFTVAPYTASGFGLHTVTYAAQINEVDTMLINDTTSFSVNITDTIYAIDNNVKFDLVGLGAGELGYLGNIFEINNATQASSVSVYLGNGIQVNGASVVDSVFKIRLFNTNPLGIPTTILASASGIIENVMDKWYTVKFATPVNLAAGKYLVALEEEFYMHELGFCEVERLQTGYIFAQTQIPWSPVEDFGFPFSFMIRLNLATSGLAVTELMESKLDIYPNPSSDKLTVSNTEAGSTVQIFNQLGQLVHSSVTSSGNTTIEVKSLENGIYIIKTIADNKIGVARFVKD